MKTKLIMLDTPIIVSDKEITDVRGVKGKWHIEKGYIINQFPDYLTDLSECKLIIAGIEGLPSIDWNSLEKEFGWVNVEKIVSEHLELNHIEASDKRVRVVSELYRKAQSLNDNKFSLEDMRMAWLDGWQQDQNEKQELKQTGFIEFIQSLQQPKVVDVDLSKLCHYDRRNPDFSIKEEYGYDREEVENTGDFAKKGCACDNCFYGRSLLTEQIIKLKSLNEKKFSLDDVEKAIDMARLQGEESFLCKYSDVEIIQSLQQPKVFDIEIQAERFRYPKGEDGWEDIYNPKITNNSIKILRKI